MVITVGECTCMHILIRFKPDFFEFLEVHHDMHAIVPVLNPFIIRVEMEAEYLAFHFQFPVHIILVSSDICFLTSMTYRMKI